MSTLEQKYLNQVISYTPPSTKVVYGKVNAITLETALREPEVIFVLDHKRMVADPDWFEEHTRVL